MKTWLQNILGRGQDHISDEAEGYLLGRGVQESTIEWLRMAVWPPGIEEAAPDPVFRERYGKFGEHLTGRLAYPLLSPRGDLIGFESRSMYKKSVTRYLLPNAAWNPVLIGFPKAMQKLWDGGDLWVVEGLFDLTAMERIVPETDAVIATVRAKLTDKHIEWIKRFLNRRSALTRVNMVYDNDETGRNGVTGYTDEKTGKFRWGALQQLGRVDVPVEDIRYKGGKDPGEIWERTGTDGLRAAFAHALPM